MSSAIKLSRCKSSVSQIAFVASSALRGECLRKSRKSRACILQAFGIILLLRLLPIHLNNIILIKCSGPGGLGFTDTTVAPTPAASTTKFLVIGAETISAIGSSVVVIGDSTFTYGPGLGVQTDVFNGETLTIGPSGINLGSTTLGGVSNSGVAIGVAGGVTITEVGSSIVIISGSTFTFGPGSTPKTTIINGQTISIGPSGIGTPSATTSTSESTSDASDPASASASAPGSGAASATGTKKNAVEGLRPTCGLIGLCIAIGVGILI